MHADRTFGSSGTSVTTRRSTAATARLLLGAGVLALGLAGCRTTGDGPAVTGSLSSGTALAASDLGGPQGLAAVQRWGAAYSRNEKDKAAALNYAAALRAVGQTGQGVAVMRKAAIYHATDREVLAGYGKALAANGNFEAALRAVRQAQRRDNPDWQLLGAEGGILDSQGDHDAARDLYRQALVLAPGEPQILNNLGMSYVLTNELDKAEETLRLAAASPRATLRVRENLALVAKLKADPAAARAASRQAALASEPTVDPEPVLDEQAVVEPVEEDTWKAIEAAG